MIAVLADDLTSALDGAAPFAGRGLSARVVFADMEFADAGTDVVSFDLDSRFLAPAAAEARFRTWGAACAPAQVLYKTLDSTLRGNLAAEARGALAGSGRRTAVVALTHAVDRLRSGGAPLP